MKTENEIIKETVEYYWQDPKGRRAASDIACEYLTADGRMCAVGRCLTPEHAARAANIICDVGRLPGLLEASLEEILQPEYRGHPVSFWDNLQTLHDTTRAWETEELLYEHLDRWFPFFPLHTLNLTRNA